MQNFILNTLLRFIPKEYGTIASGVVLILYGLVNLIGVVVPGLPVIDPGTALTTIGTGFGLIFLKRANVNSTAEITAKIDELATKVDEKTSK